MRFLAAFLMSAWMSVASAQEVLFPVIDITVSSSVRVERHPTVREGLVEVLIRGCDADLSTLLTGRTNPYVVGMDATYIAGETWIIKAMMGRTDADLRVVVENGLVLGIETLQGTNELLKFVIKTSSHLRKDGSGGIFVKRPKSNQNLRFDMPVVGPETIELACKAGLRGLVVSPRSVIVLDREKCIQIAEANDFFILAEDSRI